MNAKWINTTSQLNIEWKMYKCYNRRRKFNFICNTIRNVISRAFYERWRRFLTSPYCPLDVGPGLGTDKIGRVFFERTRLPLLHGNHFDGRFRKAFFLLCDRWTWEVPLNLKTIYLFCTKTDVQKCTALLTILCGQYIVLSSLPVSSLFFSIS